MCIPTHQYETFLIGLQFNSSNYLQINKQTNKQTINCVGN